MIVLHDSNNRRSQEFVANYTSDGDTVYDWQEGGEEEWLKLGGLWNCETFPCVVFDVPSYRARVHDRFGNFMRPRVISARQYVVSVATMDDVGDALAKINTALDVSASLGDDKPRLTRETMNRASTGRMK